MEWRQGQDCLVFFGVLSGLLYWGLPFFAGYWIWRRRKIPGASLLIGWIALATWLLPYGVLGVLFVSGYWYTEGSQEKVACRILFAVFVALVLIYVLLVRTVKRVP